MKWSEYYKQILERCNPDHNIFFFFKCTDIERLTKRCLELEKCLEYYADFNETAVIAIPCEAVRRQCAALAKEVLEKEIDE